MKGQVTYFNETRGYGFIKDSEVGSDYFFHVSQLKSDVKVGDTVKFKAVKTNKGDQAQEVMVVESG